MRFDDAVRGYRATGNAGMIFLIVCAGCLTALSLLALIVVRRRFVVVNVVGRSMLPTLRHGDRVLVRRAQAGQLTAGTVAVVQLRAPASGPDRPPVTSARLVIKRVASVPGDPVPESVRIAAGGISVVPDGKLVLLSDNPMGNDSRRWGLISGSGLLGPVISALPPCGSWRAQLAAFWRLCGAQAFGLDGQVRALASPHAAAPPARPGLTMHGHEGGAHRAAPQADQAGLPRHKSPCRRRPSGGRHWT